MRHLDLAVSSMFSEPPVPTDEDLLKTPTMSPEQDPNGLGSPTPTALRVDPIVKMVADAIENMPTSPAPSYPAGGTLESKIPRLVDTIRRETSSHKHAS